MIDFDVIEWEYLLDRDDDDRMRGIKDKIKDLPLAWRRIFWLYCDEGSYMATARILKCSPTTVKKYIDKVRNAIKND